MRVKNGHGAWRAQKGSKVRYAKDRVSGVAIVLRVLPGAAHTDNREYLIEDIVTLATYTVKSSQIVMFDKKE